MASSSFLTLTCPGLSPRLFVHGLILTDDALLIKWMRVTSAWLPVEGVQAVISEFWKDTHGNSGWANGKTQIEFVED